MNIKKIVFSIFVFFVAVAIVQPVGINFIVIVEEIPSDDPNYVINAQCRNNGDGSFEIAISPDIVGSSEQNVVFAHEIGHVNHWDDWEEEDCDNFAMEVVPGSFIHDAFSGIH